MRKKRPARRNIGIEIDPEVIGKWSKMRAINMELIHGEALTYLRSYEFTGKEFVYCDPPYLRQTRRKYYPLYKYDYSSKEHRKLLEVIKILPCMVMISGYESSLYRESLKGWTIHTFQATTHNGMATEWLWMNYPPPVDLHDYRYLGDTFRERERIQRKAARWVTRLQRMPALERKALLSAIDEHY